MPARHQELPVVRPRCQAGQARHLRSLLRFRAALHGPRAFTQRYRVQILDFASSNKLPAMFEDSSWVEAGGLMSYGPDYQEHFWTAAVVLDKILKGAKPADLPIEQPTTFELVLNLKTAKAIGREIPSTLLALATRVIE